jgi:uncharacterized membrane protein YesL
MKKTLKEFWQIFKRNWIRITLGTALLSFLFVELFYNAIEIHRQYDQVYEMYKNTESWEWWQVSHGAILLLIITWIICTYVTTIEKVVKKEIKYRKEKNR